MSGDNNTYIAGFGSDTAGGAGAMHTQGNNQAPSAVVPIPVASIEEFKVSTSNQTADFNGGGGSQMQLVTKSRHEDAAWFASTNTIWTTISAGRTLGTTTARGRAQPSSHFSRFGASAGGKIPRANFLGGGWFIFGNYEGYPFPESSEFQRDFPLPSLRAGIIHLEWVKLSI